MYATLLGALAAAGAAGPPTLPLAEMLELLQYANGLEKNMELLPTSAAGETIWHDVAWRAGADDRVHRVRRHAVPWRRTEHQDELRRRTHPNREHRAELVDGQRGHGSSSGPSLSSPLRGICGSSGGLYRREPTYRLCGRYTTVDLSLIHI